MLTQVGCTGFKSLDGFSLDFRPGLNVLVGPNGSGKTNIIVLLEFLNRLRQLTLMEAVSHMGGAGRIFRRRGGGLLKPQISISFRGDAKSISYSSNEHVQVKYSYRGEILYITERNTIIYASQQIDVSIIFEDQSTGRFILTVDSPIDDAVKVSFDCSNSKMIRYSRLRREKSELKEQIEDACQAASAIFVGDLIDRFIEGVDTVSLDLAGAVSYNIDPNKVREAEDIAAPAFIQPNGEGFAATLNMLQPRPINAALQKYMHYIPSFMSVYETPELTLRQIVQYAALVNNDVVNINVKSDPIESRLSVFIDLKYEGGYISLPISLVSDGTAKWLALITAIITRPAVFAIEEPENFLHPSMQQEIISLVRRQTLGKTSNDSDRFAILTTHSETIINSILPDELIIVSMEGGVTTAKRPSNAAQVSNELIHTGFGLSYYYMAGAIES